MDIFNRKALAAKDAEIAVLQQTIADQAQSIEILHQKEADRARLEGSDAVKTPGTSTPKSQEQVRRSRRQGR